MVDKYKEILTQRSGQRRLCMNCETCSGPWNVVGVLMGRRQGLVRAWRQEWVGWLGITRLKKLDPYWEALLSTGGALSRGRDDEGGYRRGRILLADPLASSLFMYSCARKLGEGLKKQKIQLAKLPVWVQASSEPICEPCKNVLNSHLISLTAHCQQALYLIIHLFHHAWLQMTFYGFPNQVSHWWRKNWPLDICVGEFRQSQLSSGKFLANISLVVVSPLFSVFLLPRIPARQILSLMDPFFRFLTCSFYIFHLFYLFVLHSEIIPWLEPPGLQLLFGFQSIHSDFQFKNQTINVHFILISLWMAVSADISEVVINSVYYIGPCFHWPVSLVSSGANSSVYSLWLPMVLAFIRFWGVLITCSFLWLKFPVRHLAASVCPPFWGGRAETGGSGAVCIPICLQEEWERGETCH